MQDQISQGLRMQILFCDKAVQPNDSFHLHFATELSSCADEQLELVKSLLQVEHIQRFEENDPVDGSFLHRGFRPSRHSGRAHQHLQRPA